MSSAGAPFSEVALIDIYDLDTDELRRVLYGLDAFLSESAASTPGAAHAKRQRDCAALELEERGFSEMIVHAVPPAVAQRPLPPSTPSVPYLPISMASPGTHEPPQTFASPPRSAHQTPFASPMSTPLPSTPILQPADADAVAPTEPTENCPPPEPPKKRVIPPPGLPGGTAGPDPSSTLELGLCAAACTAPPAAAEQQGAQGVGARLGLAQPGSASLAAFVRAEASVVLRAGPADSAEPRGPRDGAGDPTGAAVARHAVCEPEPPAPAGHAEPASWQEQQQQQQQHDEKSGLGFPDSPGGPGLSNGHDSGQPPAARAAELAAEAHSDEDGRASDWRSAAASAPAEERTDEDEGEDEEEEAEAGGGTGRLWLADESPEAESEAGPRAAQPPSAAPRSEPGPAHDFSCGAADAGPGDPSRSPREQRLAEAGTGSGEPPPIPLLDIARVELEPLAARLQLLFPTAPGGLCAAAARRGPAPGCGEPQLASLLAWERAVLSLFDQAVLALVEPSTGGVSSARARPWTAGNRPRSAALAASLGTPRGVQPRGPQVGARSWEGLFERGGGAGGAGAGGSQAKAGAQEASFASMRLVVAALGAWRDCRLAQLREASAWPPPHPAAAPPLGLGLGLGIELPARGSRKGVPLQLRKPLEEEEAAEEDEDDDGYSSLVARWTPGRFGIGASDPAVPGGAAGPSQPRSLPNCEDAGRAPSPRDAVAAPGPAVAAAGLTEWRREPLYFEVHSPRPEVSQIVSDVLAEGRGGIAPGSWAEAPTLPGEEASGTWNLLWTWKQPRLDYGSLLRFQRVNHFPRSSARVLYRKDLLKKSLARCAKMHGAAFDVMPSTFALPQEYVHFVDEFARSEDEHGRARNLWILKPVGSSRGRGITVLNDISGVNYAQEVVLQRYVHNPLTLDGRKFDLRVYVLVTSVRPLEAFVYSEGLARFATKQYTLDEDKLPDALVHLTNTAVQRLAPELLRSQSSSSDPSAIQGESATKCSFARLRERLQLVGVDFGVLWVRIVEVVVRSLVSVEDAIEPHCCAFELFGYDVLIEESSLRPWLIEVNASPSLERETALDVELKERLIGDTVRLLAPPFFDRAVLRRMAEWRLSEHEKGAKHASRLAAPPFESEMHALLHGGTERRVGELPAELGLFQRIVPSPFYERITRNKRTSSSSGT